MFVFRIHIWYYRDMRTNDEKEKIRTLRDYFQRRDDIVMAFVFGSRASGRAHAGSDWDIAVYITPEKGELEQEKQERSYPQEKDMRADCMTLLKTDNVDLVILNRAPATLADAALRGSPLTIKDRGLWLRFMLAITRKAEDFRKTAREYAQVYWRSSSLSKEDAYELDRRLLFIDGELSVLPEFSTMDWLEYQKNNHRRREVERLIENIMNAVIDVSKIILASEKRSAMPETYREIVKAMGSVSPFSSGITDQLASWAGLRNILAHEYLDYRWNDIKEFLNQAESFIRSFVESARIFAGENHSKKMGA